MPEACEATVAGIHDVECSRLDISSSSNEVDRAACEEAGFQCTYVAAASGFQDGEISCGETKTGTTVRAGSHVAKN